MKKYIKPQTTVYQLKLASILCASENLYMDPDTNTNDVY